MQVAVENFKVSRESGAANVNAQFKIKNTSRGYQRVAGNAVVLLKGADLNKDQWLVMAEPEVFEELCPLFTDLLHQAGLLPEHSTFPGDPPERGLSISHDIMLHKARARMRCAQVSDTCYRLAPRPCPAKAKGKAGCACTDPACAERRSLVSSSSPRKRATSDSACSRTK